MDIIKTENVTYTYPVYEMEEETPSKEPDKALDEVSLCVHPGQFICILGSNGSGKSTFAKQLNALLTPTEGTVWVDGMDTKDENQVWEIRKSIGMVFQNPDNQIIGSIVDEDVAFGLENIGAETSQIREGVAKALEEVNMSAYAKASPNKLSGGQKQRVAVAGVLAMHPKCIVLDESTSMLDPRGRKEVMDTVMHLNKNQGITILSITHYMEEALDADYIFVMNEGRVVMQGTPKEIFANDDAPEQYGLVLPQICQIAKRLRDGGMDIPQDIISEEELEAAVRAAGVRS